MAFWVNVPNSLITGPSPIGPVQFHSTFVGYDAAWFLAESGMRRRLRRMKVRAMVASSIVTTRAPARIPREVAKTAVTSP